MSDEYYRLLDQNCPMIQLVEKFIPRAIWQWVPHMHVCQNIDFIRDELYESDPFLDAAHKELDGTIQLYKFPAKTFYTWHEDAAVGCSLNMVLKSHESYTLFSTCINHDVLHSTILLDYIPKRWYAFNSQRLHAVSNYGNEDRFLFTMIFMKPLSYAKLLKWYTEYVT